MPPDKYNNLTPWTAVVLVAAFLASAAAVGFAAPPGPQEDPAATATACDCGIQGTVAKRTGDWMPPVDRSRAKLIPLSVEIRAFRAGCEVARTQSDAQGRYQLALNPGRYAVMVVGLDRAAVIEVHEGRWAQLNFFDDSEATF